MIKSANIKDDPLKKIDKIDKPLCKLVQEKKRTQITNMRNDRGNRKHFQKSSTKNYYE